MCPNNARDAEVFVVTYKNGDNLHEIVLKEPQDFGTSLTQTGFFSSAHLNPVIIICQTLILFYERFVHFHLFLLADK